MTFHTETAGDWLELPLPQGRWRLMLTRHDWSGQVLVRDAGQYAIHELYAP